MSFAGTSQVAWRGREAAAFTELPAQMGLDAEHILWYMPAQGSALRPVWLDRLNAPSTVGGWPDVESVSSPIGEPAEQCSR